MELYFVLINITEITPFPFNHAYLHFSFGLKCSVSPARMNGCLLIVFALKEQYELASCVLAEMRSWSHSLVAGEDFILLLLS